MRFLKATLIAGFVVGCSAEEATDFQSADEESPDGLASVAQHAIAGRLGIPLENVKMTNAVTGQYPSLGKVTREYKAVDERNGKIYSVALDESGQEVDARELQQREFAAREALERRLDPPLARWLADARPGERIEVAIWLKEPFYSAPARPAPGSAISSAQGDGLVAQATERRSTFVKALTEPFAARLRGRGFQVKADTQAPLVYATLSPAVIEELRDSRDVDRMYLPVIAQPTLQAERTSIYAHVVNSRGITGAGVPVAAVEVGGRIATANPYLSGVTQDLPYSCTSGHAAAVAGIIRSTHSPETGVALGSNLWVGGSCSGSSSELLERSTAASTWGALAFNLSFGADTQGALTELDRYYDSLVINQFKTVVPAAGNSGNGNIVGSPGSAYNVLTVGAYDEQTGLIAGFSSGGDPGSSHSDREKPEVAAPGVDFLSTINGAPWVGGVGSGTSYAAPMATGTAALMMQRNTSLQHWPEAVRAILMATAIRNIEGASRLSDLDGAGGIFADYADDVARGVNGGWGGIGYDCNTASPLVVGSAYVTAGRMARVVISYDTDPSYGGYHSQPSADLDLLIKGPSNTYVASSSSYDNTYEIVEFVASETGTFTFEVAKFRCDLSPRWLAHAYFVP